MVKRYWIPILMGAVAAAIGFLITYADLTIYIGTSRLTGMPVGYDGREIFMTLSAALGGPIAVLLKDSESRYKTNMLVLRAWACLFTNHGEEAVSSLEMNYLIEPLTERELEILRRLSSHLPTPEIANMLSLSVNTVRTHIKSIYAKLGVHNRTTAIDVSKKLKLLA